jgi:hypothetical protein
MKRLALTPALREAARRCLWFKTPEEAIDFPEQLAAHILTYGATEDIDALRAQLGIDDIRDALDAAPPGVFDARSWAYWNVKVGRFDAPPMPIRRFE